MKRWAVRIAAVVCIASFGTGLKAVGARPSLEVPLQQLREGGNVILLRHPSPAGRGEEPSPLDLADCAVQRQLSEEGRADARTIGAAFRSLGVPVGEVLASRYCRTMEAAQLAFGRAEAAPELLHPTYLALPSVAAPAPYPQRREALQRRLATFPAPGSNTVLVTHGETILDAMGLDLANGEAAIYRPDGRGGTALIGRVRAREWLPEGVPSQATAAPAPIETRTLFETRIELPVERPLCWDVRQGSLAPGSKSPATGFHTHGWVVAYVTGGAERVTYEGGKGVATLTAGQAGLFAAGSPHLHESIGPTARTNIGFELSCQRLTGSQGNTGPLPGIRPGQVAYQIQARVREWPVGSQTAVHLLSGPTATYVIEGAIARATPAGIAQSSAGELYVSPVGELAQNTNIGSTPARTLDVDLWPAGETRSVAQPPEIRLPSPLSVGMPNAGDGGLAATRTDDPSWPPVAAALGLSAVALAVAFRRTTRR